MAIFHAPCREVTGGRERRGHRIAPTKLSNSYLLLRCVRGIASSPQARARQSRHSEHCLDTAHHRDEPWSDIACQLTLAEQERGDAAIENQDRSVGH